MTARLQKVGLALTVLGLVFAAAAAYSGYKTMEGYQSLNALSAAQNVKLSYNDQGQLVDRGDVAEGQAIMSLLKNDWKYPVNDADLNPNDPVVNTASEYMVQMATISYHTLHGTQKVTLDKDITYNGVFYKAGTPIEFKVDGRYWSAFDRSDPVQAAAREKAWTGTAHALIAELGVGTATATALQLGLGITGLFAGIGFFALIAGLGLVWAVRAAEERAPKVAFSPKAIPA